MRRPQEERVLTNMATRVYVGGLSENITERELEEEVSGFILKHL